MLNKMKEKFKYRYLLVLLILPVIFFIKSADAGDSYIVFSYDDLFKHVRYKFYSEEGSFTQKYSFKLNDKMPFPERFEICNRIKDDFKNFDPFVYHTSGCTSTAFSGFGDNVTTIMYFKSYLTATERAKLMKHVEEESKRMLAKTTNKEELVLMVIKHVYYDIMQEEYAYTSNGFFDSEEYTPKSKEGLISSLFFTYLGIEHKIVKGITTGSTMHWNMIKLNDTWFHCYRDEIACYLTDSEMSNDATWDYGSYPKANKKYVRNVSTSKAVIVPPKAVLKPVEKPINYLELTPVEQKKYDQLIPVVPQGPSTWAVSAVDEAINNGLVEESLRKNYQASITRAEFASILVAINNKINGENSSSTNPFNDLYASNQYYRSVLSAYDLGLVTGLSSTTYGPDKLITREQIAVMFKRLIDKMGYSYTLNQDNITFADSNQISSWANESVQVLYKLEILGGVGENKINPKGNTTREQAIALANRVYNMVKN